MRVSTAAGLLVASMAAAPVGAQALPSVTYVFDTVTAVELTRDRPSITGLAKDTGQVITATFLDTTSQSYQYVVNRCVPIFLTALEKPGRYCLHVTVEPMAMYQQLVGCKLELKNG